MQKEKAAIDLGSEELAKKLDAMKAEWTKENEQDEYPGYSEYLSEHRFITEEDVELMAELDGEYD